MNFRHKHIFLLPGLLVLIGILIFPILFTVRLSLSSWDSFYPGLDFIGLENYIRLFTDDLRFCGPHDMPLDAVLCPSGLHRPQR